MQREKESGDLVKKKFEQAEKEKEKYLKTFEQSAKEASAERERILQKGEDLIKDKLKQADEDKKRHLETFDKLAKHEDKKVQKTPGEPHGPLPFNFFFFLHTCIYSSSYCTYSFRFIISIIAM